MKYFYYLFLLVIFYQPLCAVSYVDSLDSIMNKKVNDLTALSYDVENLVYTIKSNIKKQVSLWEIDEFLDYEHSVVFFFHDQVSLKSNELFGDENIAIVQPLKDLKFVLGAKLYLYYLECCKQKMLYRAVKNYDTLSYWQNEKFLEDQAFYQKNLLQWLSRSTYQLKIQQNIEQLEEITKQTDSFLGLIKHNQDLLLQSATQQEFELNLMIALCLQDEFLHIKDEDYKNYDIGFILKSSIDQIHRFNEGLSLQYEQCQLPSHFERHWQGYTMTAVGMCICAFVYTKYGENIINSTQHFWQEHIEGPLDRNIQVLSGYARAPQLPTEKHETIKLDTTCHEENMKVLIEAGIALPPARGNDVTIHEALARDIDTVSNGEFSAKFKQIDDKMAMMDELAKEVGPIVKTVKPIADESNVWYARYQDFKKQHPNMLWGDWSKYLKAMRDPVFPDVYQQDSRGIVQDAYNFVTLQDPSLPTVNQQVVTDQLAPVDLDSNLQASFKSASGDFGQSVQDKFCRLPEQVVDSSSWTFEQKKSYVEDQHKIIMANPYKNSLRFLEPYFYKIEKESLQAKQAANQYSQRIEDESLEAKKLVNKFSQDVFVLLGLTALIPMITVVGGSLFASKKLYNSVAYQPIRKFVHRLEVYLNESLYKPVSFDREGHLYFLTEQLKLNIGVLTIPEQKLIDIDIAALQNQDLDYVQKFNVIQRMYRTYPCLVPGTV